MTNSATALALRPGVFTTVTPRVAAASRSIWFVALRQRPMKRNGDGSSNTSPKRKSTSATTASIDSSARRTANSAGSQSRRVSVHGS